MSSLLVATATSFWPTGVTGVSARTEVPFGFPASFGGMRLRLLFAAIAVGLWVTAGLGHSVLLNQCYESRHAADRQPMVFGGVVGHVITVAMWPLYASAIVLDPPDCKTIPVSSG